MVGVSSRTPKTLALSIINAMKAPGGLIHEDGLSYAVYVDLFAKLHYHEGKMTALVQEQALTELMVDDSIYGMLKK
jgi:hypothetical protein